jgi:hypothetical protein
MTNIEQVRKKLLRPSGYAIVPNAYKDIPLPFPEWEIQDDNGVGTGLYHTPQTLSTALGGSTLVLIPYIDDRFFLMRHGS